MCQRKKERGGGGGGGGGGVCERKGGVIMKVLFGRLETGPEPNPMRTSLHLKWGLSQGMLNAK